VKPIGLIALPFIGLQYAGVGASWARKFKSWILTGLAAAAVIIAMYLFVGAGYGVLSAAFGTPGGVLTWLSPTTAVGQAVGGITTLLGISSDAYGVIGIIRTLGTVLSLGVIIWLLATSDRRTPLRGLALAFGVVVLLGAVVHPWYVLWALPLFAASGLNLRERRIMIIVTIVLIIHGMIESSTAADNVWDLTDVITFILALATVAIISLASPRERALVLGVNAPARP